MDKGGMYPIVKAFQDFNYNEDFHIILKHTPSKRIRVEKYPLLCSIVNEIRKNGNVCNITMPIEKRCSQLNYAARMGFLKFLGIDYEYTMKKRAGRGRFIEVRNLNNYYYPEEEFLKVFQDDFKFSENDAHDVATIFSELINNSFMHSENKGGSIMYGQKYPTKEFLNLFFIDSGIGIDKAMRVIDKYKDLSQLQILQKSLEFGEGNGKGYGQGLYLTSQFIKRNFGYLRLITGDYLYEISNGVEKFIEIPSNYKGVILNLGIRFEINVSIQEIMDEQMR